MIKELSDKIASYLSSEIVTYKDKEDVLSYGLQIIFSVLSKTLGIVIIASILGILKPTLVVLLSYIIFRQIIGGTHCSTFGNCFIVTLGLFISISYLSSSMNLNLGNLITLTNIIFALCIFITFLWIPGESSQRKFDDPTLRDKIKIKTVIYLSLWILLIRFMIRIGYNQYVFSSLLGCLTAFVLASPLGYKFIHRLDSTMNFLMKGGKLNV